MPRHHHHGHDHHHPSDGGARVDLTRNQALVLGALESHGAPLSAYALLDALRPEGFRAPLQVYRALDRLVAGGLVHRLETLNAFVACAHPHEHGGAQHRHDTVVAFAICADCNSVSEFSDEVVAERLNGWAVGNAFRPSGTVIEMRGTCGRCAAA